MSSPSSTVLDSSHHDTEYSVIDLSAENEHFSICDTLIASIELMKSCSSSSSHFDADRCDQNNHDSNNIAFKNNGLEHSSGNNTTSATDTNDSDCSANLNDANSGHNSLVSNKNELHISRESSEKNIDLINNKNSLEQRIHSSRLHPTAATIAWSLLKRFTDRHELISSVLSVPQLDNGQETISTSITTLVDNIDKKLTLQNSCGSGNNGKSPNEQKQLIQMNSTNNCEQTATSINQLLQNHNATAQSDNNLANNTQSNDVNNGSSPAGGNKEIIVRIRGNDEWAPPRAQIIFNIHSDPKLKKLLTKQNYRCAGCGIAIDVEMAARLVLYCHYLGKYFCKCCHSHKSIHLPGYILQKWDFHKYPVSYFAFQLLSRIANEPLFNLEDINSSLYKKVRKLRRFLDIRIQLYYLQIYIKTCTQTAELSQEYASFAHQHLLHDEVHLYSLNNLIEIQHGKLFEYLNDLVSRSIAHVAQCDRCRAKGHYCQLCGPSGLASSMSSCSSTTRASAMTLTSNSSDSNINGEQSRKRHSRNSSGTFSYLPASFQNSVGSSGSGATSTQQQTGTTTSKTNQFPILSSSSFVQSIDVDDPGLIFPFEIGRVAQCNACGCCFHLQCFLDAGNNCPKCERAERRRKEGERMSTYDQDELLQDDPISTLGALEVTTKLETL